MTLFIVNRWSLGEVGSDQDRHGAKVCRKRSWVLDFRNTVYLGASSFTDEHNVFDLPG